MGISESKKNSILPYAVAGALFVVACVLQQTDDLVSDLNTSKFMVLAAQCIFFGILTYWTVSVINRVSDKNIRTGLATTIIFMSMVLLLKLVSTQKEYTFTVAEGTTLTAVYEDTSSGGEITPPAKKDGLPGGAIAGIVIGSVAVAGIGGFAIFWFAVKKKTFADLGVALKKGFTAIGNFFKNLGAKIKALFTKKK